MAKLEQKLLEELNRYKAINKYIAEQATPPPAPAADAEALPPVEGGDTGTDMAAPPPADGSADMGAAPADAAAPPPAPAETTAPPPMAEDQPMGGDVEKLDVTDLVNMTKELKSKVEQEANKNQDAVHKMDSIFSKLDDLANQLHQMDALVSKIDNLEQKVSDIKPLSAEEKLNLRSYDSYPFNQKLSDFFRDKQPEMELTRKNDYILKPEDGENYSKDDIEKSFENF